MRDLILAVPSADNYVVTYPHDYPDGWYGICRTDEVAMRPVCKEYFGQTYTISGNSDGEILVTSAKERIPIHVSNGTIFVWNDATGRRPFFTIPTIPELSDPQWTKLRGFRAVFRTNIQELRENFCDESHFVTVHKQAEIVRVAFSSSGAVGIAKSVLRAKIFPWLVYNSEATMFGPGLMVVRLFGPVNVLAYVLTTPIDRVFSEMRFYTAGHCKTLAQWFPARILSYYVCHKARSDLRIEGRIWQHKIYKSNPIYAPHEKGVAQLRQWYRQFVR